MYQSGSDEYMEDASSGTESERSDMILRHSKEWEKEAINLGKVGVSNLFQSYRGTAYCAYPQNFP